MKKNNFSVISFALISLACLPACSTVRLDSTGEQIFSAILEEGNYQGNTFPEFKSSGVRSPSEADRVFKLALSSEEFELYLGEYSDSITWSEVRAHREHFYRYAKLPKEAGMVFMFIEIGTKVVYLVPASPLTS